MERRKGQIKAVLVCHFVNATFILFHLSNCFFKGLQRTTLVKGNSSKKNTGNMADHKGGLTIWVCLFLETLDPINKACLMV